MNNDISIIVPVYNSEKYLHQCIDSICNQTKPNIEIICVDDGSTDNSLNILNEYKEKDSRIKIISQKNQGPGIARNTGLEAANGEYIYFLDSDDWVENNICEEVYNVALQNNKPDFIRFRCHIFNQETNKVGHDAYLEMSRGNQDIFNKTYPINFFIYFPVATWLGVYKREFLQTNNINFTNLKVAEDLVFQMTIISKAESGYLSDLKPIWHRINPKSLCYNRAKYFACEIAAYNYVKEIFDKNLEIRTKILDHCLFNILSWYCKNINNRKYGLDIYRMTRNFLKDIDLTFYHDNNKLIYDLFCIIRDKNYLICRTVPFIWEIIYMRIIFGYKDLKCKIIYLIRKRRKKKYAKH